VFDLSADPTPLLELDAEEIRHRLFTRAADLPAGVERIPLKTVHLNRCPVLVPINTLRPVDAERLSLDLDGCRSHLEALKADSALATKLQAVFTKPQPDTPAEDPDFMIYSGGFFSGPDKQKMARLRDMTPGQLALTHPAFDDPRLPEMLFRYRARNWPDSLTQEEKARWEQFRHKRLTEKNLGGGLTGSEFEGGLAQLENQPGLKPKDREILAQLREWGCSVVMEGRGG